MLPLNPGEESLDDPTPLVTTQPRTVLSRLANAIGSVRCDYLVVMLATLCIQFVAVVRAIANQIFQSRLDHVEVERQLDQRDLVVIGPMRRDRERQAVTVDDRHDVHAFSAHGRSNLFASALGRCERGIEIELRLLDGPLFAQGIGQIRQCCANHFVLALLLKATMNRFLARIELRKHVPPLRAGVQNPQHRLERLARRDRLATRADRRDNSPPETASGSDRTARRSAAACIEFIYELARSKEFEIGSSQFISMFTS